MRRSATRLLLLMLLAALWPLFAAAQNATPVPAGVMVATMLSAVFETAPEAPAFVGVARFTLPPGVGVGGGSLDGPRIYMVEEGVITLSLLERATVVRGREFDARIVEFVAADHEVALGPSDALIVQRVPPLEVRNDGSRPAIFLDIAIWPEVGGQIKPFTSPEGIVFEPLSVGTADNLPPAPIMVALTVTTIPPDQVVPLGSQEGPRLIYVRSGRLGLGTEQGSVTYMPAAFSSPGAVPGTARTLTPGRRALLTAGSSVMFQAGATGTTENLGRTRLMLLVLTVAPVQS